MVDEVNEHDEEDDDEDDVGDEVDDDVPPKGIILFVFTIWIWLVDKIIFGFNADIRLWYDWFSKIINELFYEKHSLFNLQFSLTYLSLL